MTSIKASEVMTTDVKTVREDTPLTEVAEILAANKISGVPVVDESGSVVGVVSEADLLDERKRDAVIPHMAIFGLYIVPDRLIHEAYKEGFAMKARDVMSRHVVTAEEDASVEALADLMLHKRINRIPITRDGKLVGIVTRADVLRGLRGMPRVGS